MLPNMVTSSVWNTRAKMDVLLTKRLPARKSNGARNGTLIPTRSDERKRERLECEIFITTRRRRALKITESVDFAYFMVRRLEKSKK